MTHSKTTTSTKGTLMSRTMLKSLIAGLALAASASTAVAEQFGASLLTPGYEDVVILDPITMLLLNGAEDGLAAQSLYDLWSDSQRDEKNHTVTYEELVFKKHLPGVADAARNLQILPVKAAQVQSMVIARRHDILSAKTKRFLVIVPFDIAVDQRKRASGGAMTPARDTLGNYILRVRHNPDAFLKSDAGGTQMMFCQRVDRYSDGKFKSSLAGVIRSNCMVTPNLTGMNLPWGILMADASKLPGAEALFRQSLGMGQASIKVHTVAVGFIVAPSGSVAVSNGFQGRDYEAQSLVLFDSATWQVVAGPFDLKKRDPKLVYATVDCKGPVTEGACRGLNPTVPESNLTFASY